MTIDINPSGLPADELQTLVSAANCTTALLTTVSLQAIQKWTITL
jgi:hypothetical protein